MRLPRPRLTIRWLMVAVAVVAAAIAGHRAWRVSRAARIAAAEEAKFAAYWRKSLAWVDGALTDFRRELDAVGGEGPDTTMLREAVSQWRRVRDMVSELASYYEARAREHRRLAARPWESAPPEPPEPPLPERWLDLEGPCSPGRNELDLHLLIQRRRDHEARYRAMERHAAEYATYFGRVPIPELPAESDSPFDSGGGKVQSDQCNH